MSGLLVVPLDTGAGENWRECADVLFTTRRFTPADARLLASLALERYPGCALVCVPQVEGGWLLGARCGLTVALPADPSAGVRPVH